MAYELGCFVEIEPVPPRFTGEATGHGDVERAWPGPRHCEFCQSEAFALLLDLPRRGSGQRGHEGDGYAGEACGDRGRHGQILADDPVEVCPDRRGSLWRGRVHFGLGLEVSPLRPCREDVV